MYHACSTPPIQNRKIHNKMLIFEVDRSGQFIDKQDKDTEITKILYQEMDVHAALQQHGDRRQEDGDDQQEQIGCKRTKKRSRIAER
jgi:hypothetical protein